MNKQIQSLEDTISTEPMNERKRRFSFVGDIRDLEQFESVRSWLSRVRQDGTGSEITSYTYLRHLNLYCGYWKKNPDQLIEERERELKSDQEKVCPIKVESLNS